MKKGKDLDMKCFQHTLELSILTFSVPQSNKDIFSLSREINVVDHFDDLHLPLTIYDSGKSNIYLSNYSHS